jgi:thymidylate synthase
MNTADKQYLDIAKQILNEGFDHETRAHYADGTIARAKKLTQVEMNFDLSKDFPILTSKKLARIMAYKEAFWIYVMGSNKIEDLHQLNVKVWDEWVKPDGTIGPAYGDQARHWKKHHFDANGNYINTTEIDQVQRLIDGLINNPYGRRHIINLWNVGDLGEMALQPCAFETEWSVVGDRLDCFLNQRSGDAALGIPFNTTQYAMFIHMIARVTGLKPGKFKHYINDVHIYDRHEEGIRLQLQQETFDLPTLWVNDQVTDFNKFTVNDVKVLNYQHGPEIKFEVAI